MRHEIPLGIIADKLEEGGEPGRAAVVRALEYLKRENIESFDDAVHGTINAFGDAREYPFARSLSKAFYGYRNQPQGKSDVDSNTELAEWEFMADGDYPILDQYLRPAPPISGESADRSTDNDFGTHHIDATHESDDGLRFSDSKPVDRPLDRSDRENWQLQGMIIRDEPFDPIVVQVTPEKGNDSGSSLAPKPEDKP